MRKWFSLILISLFLFIPSVYANSIKNINMDIYIDDEGTAHVKEVWQVRATKGTEIYKTYNNIGSSNFTDFKASLNGNEFTNIGSWDVNGSFDDKAYRNGINYISDGLELCFGISEYGNNTYAFEYNITNFVVNLNDSQMVYWTLIPKNMSNTVSNIYIKIHSSFRYPDTLDIWGYGKYGAPAYVYDGYIEMSSDYLDSDEYMTALIRFEPNTFNTTYKIDKDFSYYYDLAEDGSDDYKAPTKLENFLTGFFNLSIIAFIFCMIAVLANRSSIKNARYRKSKKKLPADIPYFRDIPGKKELFRNYYISNLYGIILQKSDFLGSVLLKWMKEGSVTIEKTEKKGVFKKNDIVTAMKIGDVVCNNSLEKELYNMIKSAAKDDYLESDEFKKWARNHYDKILSWFDKALNYQGDALISDGSIQKHETQKMLFKSVTFTESDSILDEAIQLAGLKKYLIDFSNMKEKEAIEVHLWQDYLIYAQMFGIAKRVAEQFKKMYPEIIDEYNHNFDFDTVIYINDFSRSAISSANAARSAAIERANSYSSGGGGFSSGGGGGGSFGGGSGGGGFR
ncbi:MAG: DUF2207 domain-containing protein [bacterium]|nr:DUF2207 domain-containing protein [bacterium]